MYLLCLKMQRLGYFFNCMNIFPLTKSKFYHLLKQRKLSVLCSLLIQGGLRIFCHWNSHPLLLKSPFKSSNRPIHFMELFVCALSWCFTPPNNVVRERSEERQRKVNLVVTCLLPLSSVSPQVFFSIRTVMHQPQLWPLWRKNVAIMGQNWKVTLWSHMIKSKPSKISVLTKHIIFLKECADFLLYNIW